MSTMANGYDQLPLAANDYPSPNADGVAEDSGSWAARYGQLILRDGVASLPRALFLYQDALGLSAQEMWFVGYIMAHKWNADLPYPSLRQMAEASGVDLSWLKRLRKRLEEKGYLLVVQRHDGRGGQAANSYDFAPLLAAIEDAIAAEPLSGNAIRDEGVPGGYGPDLQPDTSFVARYGRVIARAGIAAIPRGLFAHQAELQLTAQQLWFVCYILSYQWDTAMPYPSLKRMVLRTGYSEPQLHSIKDSLVQAGYLRVVHRHGSNGGQSSNGYDFSGLLDALTACLETESAPPAPAPPPIQRQPSPRRGRRSQATNNEQMILSYEGGADSLAGGGREELSGEGVLTVKPVGVRTVKPGGARTVKPEGARESDAGQNDENRGRGARIVKWEGALEVKPGGALGVKQGGAGSLVPGGAGSLVAGGAYSLAEIESLHEEEYNQDQVDSNHHAHAKKANDETNRYSPYIAGVILDFSQALGDGAHAAANVAQALRLWSASGAGEAEFVERHLYEALRRTRQAQGAQGNGMILNKMAYFFRVLRDLVEPSGVAE